MPQCLHNAAANERPFVLRKDIDERAHELRLRAIFVVYPVDSQHPDTSALGQPLALGVLISLSCRF
jgi:hypothetical protein